MPVTERLQAMGQWSLTLRPGTPKAVRDALAAPYQSIVITPSWVDSAGMSDAAMLGAAIYNGVILRPGPQYEIGGVGLVWWLGDDKGVPYHPNLVRSSGQSLSAWVTAFLANTQGVDTVGTVTGGGPVGGNIGGYFLWLSARAALEAIFKYYQVEYRVNPNYTLDYGTAADLYGSTAVATALPRGQGGRESGLAGFRVTDLEYSRDFTDYLSFITASGRGGTGQASAASSISSLYGAYDPDGDVISRAAFFDVPDASPGLETNYAESIIDRYSDVDQVGISTDDFVRSSFGPGYFINVYDPDRGLADETNQTIYQGDIIFPKLVRVVGMTWPIQHGVGVYHRAHAGLPSTTVTYTDLTPYVEWEQPGTRIEVANAAYSAIADQFSVSAQAANVSAGAWDTYTPTVTNGSVGNGTINGYFRRQGTTLHLRVRFTLGSTSTITGALTISLPSGVTAVTETDGFQMLPAILRDTGTTVYHGMGVVTSGATSIVMYAQGANVTYLTQNAISGTVPHTWASTDVITLNGTIEVAP